MTFITGILKERFENQAYSGRADGEGEGQTTMEGHSEGKARNTVGGRWINGMSGREREGQAHNGRT